MSTTNPILTPKDKVKSQVEKMLKEIDNLKQRLPEIERDAEEKISIAKSRLMQMEPFFAMLLFKMPVYPCYQITSMGTDGTVLLYNPIFVAEKLLRKDVIFVLLHEIEHVFLKHNIRGPVKALKAQHIFKRAKDLAEKGVKDMFLEREVDEMSHKLKEWNFATDYTINHHIKKDVKLPISKELEKQILFDENFKDMTSETVYDKIKTPYDPKKDPSNDDLGIGAVYPVGFGDLTESEVRQLEKEFEQEVHAAALTAQKAGKLPKGVKETIESLYQTSTPWQDIFRTVFTSINKQDYTFLYPNKRYTTHMMEYGVIMPSLWGEEYVDAGFIMDTSGSVGKREKDILVSELKNILEDYNIRLHVLYCDTQAYTDDVEILTRDDIRNGRLKLNVKGGGGTKMKPGFDYFKTNMDNFNFEVVICLTDMYLFDWGKLGSEPPFSVYWAMLPGYNKQAVPDWGVKIELQIDN